MPALDIYRAAIASRVNGINCLNTFYFKQVDADQAEDVPDSLSQAINEDLVPVWAAMISNQASLDSVVVRRISPTGSQPYSFTLVAGTGTIAEESEPANLAVCVSHYSRFNERAGRGRNYYSGIPQTQIQGAIPKASWVTLFNTFLAVLDANIIYGMSNINWRWIHWSNSLANASAIEHVEQRMQLRTIRGRNI